MKRTPLKRKTPLRRSAPARMPHGKVWANFAKVKPPKPRKPLKKVSRSQRRRLAEYAPIRSAFLALPENELCAICTARREAGENIVQNYATEVHHAAGRSGALLFDTRYFRASCFPCRLWPHENPAKARTLGLVVDPRVAAV